MKIRGTASHIAEKYMQLARDAQSSGDHVGAENYFQHAEHYFRIIAAAQAQNQQQNPGEQPRQRGNGADDSADDGGETPRQGRESARDRTQGDRPQPADQPQPDIDQPQPTIAAGPDDKGSDAQPAEAAGGDGDKEQGNGSPPPRRRRRKTAAEKAAEAAAAAPESEPVNGGQGDHAAAETGEKPEQPAIQTAGDGPDETLLTTGEA